MPSRRKSSRRIASATAGFGITGKAPVKASRSRAKLLQALFEQNAAGMLVLEYATMQILEVNPQFCAITGYPAEALIGRSIEEITCVEDVEGDRAILARFRASGEMPPPRREKRYRRADGSCVWVEVTVSVLRDEQQAPFAMVGVVEDITGRKQLEGQVHLTGSTTILSEQKRAEEEVVQLQHDLAEQASFLV